MMHSLSLILVFVSPEADICLRLNLCLIDVSDILHSIFLAGLTEKTRAGFRSPPHRYIFSQFEIVVVHESRFVSASLPMRVMSSANLLSPLCCIARLHPCR